MKLACASSAFDALLCSGALTQLEWVDHCAHDFGLDGAVFDVRHFPRTDDDYLAQIKKTCADLGLCVAALREDDLVTLPERDAASVFQRALALGAPLVACALPNETAMPLADAQESLSRCCSLAKKANVTLALRNRPQTFAAGAADLKRSAKEADSAWLRFGPEFSALEAGSDAQGLLARTVLAWERLDAHDCAERIAPLRALRGFLALDAPAGDARPDEAKSAFRRWREALALQAEPAVVDRT